MLNFIEFKQHFLMFFDNGECEKYLSVIKGAPQALIRIFANGPTGEPSTTSF